MKIKNKDYFKKKIESNIENTNILTSLSLKFTI